MGFLPVQTSEHMAAIGVFGLIQLYTFFKYALASLPKNSMFISFCIRALIIEIKWA